jgi:hypothetical protein
VGVGEVGGSPVPVGDAEGDGEPLVVTAVVPVSPKPRDSKTSPDTIKATMMRTRPVLRFTRPSYRAFDIAGARG